MEDKSNGTRAKDEGTGAAEEPKEKAVVGMGSVAAGKAACCCFGC